MSFETQIKDWIELDNQIKIENEKIKELRNKKNKLNYEIIKYSIDNNLSNATIEVNDSKLNFINTKTQTSLTLKYVETCLKTFIKDENSVNKIMEHIKKNRDIKNTIEIKRTYNK